MRIISAKDYVEFVRSADNALRSLQKTRSKFIVDLQPFTLETITNLAGKPTFLRVETANEKVLTPDFFKIIKEVTHLEQYSSYEIAKRGGIPDY